MPSADRQAHAVWQGDLFSGEGEVTFDSSSIGTYPVTWSSRVEQPSGRTSPEELVAAAHAACYAMAFSNVLAQNGTTAERLHVTATVSLGDNPGGGIRVTRSQLEVAGQVPGLDQASFQRLAEQAEQACPISGALRGNLEITVAAKLES